MEDMASSCQAIKPKVEDCQAIKPKVEDFLCAICRDLVYKPIVNVCGHFFCFWCKHQAMSPFRESYCPLCRRSFCHFPRVCELLHAFLLHAFPEEYAVRERETREMEDTKCISSPEIQTCLRKIECGTQSDGNLSDKDHAAAAWDDAEAEHANFNQGMGAVGQSVALPMDALPFIMVEGVGTVGESLIPRESEKNTGKLRADDGSEEVRICMDDFRCGQCRQLLWKPIVLNCGHVFCSHPCMSVKATSREGHLCCPTCHARQPEGLPSVCEGLKDILQTAFPDSYARRDAEMSGKASSSAIFPLPCADSEEECSRACLCSPRKKIKQNGSSEAEKKTEVQNAYEHIAASQRQLQELPEDSPDREALQFKLDLKQKEWEIHSGVGCDSCGAYPIVGQRFHCRTCPEQIGYDLCGKCQAMPAPLPTGRFNQRHTSDHDMEEIVVHCPAMNPLQQVVEQNPHMSLVEVAQLLHLVTAIQQDDGSTFGSESELDDSDGEMRAFFSDTSELLDRNLPDFNPPIIPQDSISEDEPGLPPAVPEGWRHQDTSGEGSRRGMFNSTIRI